MTIYKTQSGEKKVEKDPEVLTEPLTGVKDDSEEEAVVAPKLVRVTYLPRRRRTWVNLCLIMAALLVLGTGTIAAIFLYRHLSNRVVRGRCGVTYFDEAYHGQPEQMQMDKLFETQRPADREPPVIDMDFFEEDIEVSAVDMYERLSIPRFDEVAETVVWHDFTKNLTAIVDPTHQTCYIMPLNRSNVAPPLNLIDLLQKLKTHYYMPKASVIREQYRVVLPPLSITELPELGAIIMRECYWYYTFRLEKHVTGVWKRSTDSAPPTLHLEAHVGFFSLQASDSSSHVFKYDIYKEEKVEAPADIDPLQNAPTAL